MSRGGCGSLITENLDDERLAREDRVEFVPVARAGQGLSIAATATSTRGHATETTEAFLQTPVPNSTILSISFGRMSSSTGLLARAKADRFEEPLAGEREREKRRKKKKEGAAWYTH